MAVLPQGAGPYEKFLRDKGYIVDEPMIRLVTPPCMLCAETSTIELTRKEFSMLAHPARPSVDLCLPDRDLDFRELVMTGTHPKCWDELTKPLDDDE